MDVMRAPVGSREAVQICHSLATKLGSMQLNFIESFETIAQNLILGNQQKKPAYMLTHL